MASFRNKHIRQVMGDMRLESLDVGDVCACLYQPWAARIYFIVLLW